MNGETSIAELKTRLTIPDVWATLNLPGTPGKSCKSPFREDQRPSFSVYDEGRRFKDHATGEAGDVLDFVKLALQCDTKAAVQWLRERDGDSPTAPAPKPAPRPAPGGAKAKWPQLQPGSDAEFAALAALRSLPVEALQLAAARGKGGKAAACRIVDGLAQTRIDDRHVAIEIESFPVPVGAEDPLEKAAEGRLAVDGSLQKGPTECVGHFAARQPAEIAWLAVPADRSGIEGACSREFALGKAVVRCRATALKNLRMIWISPSQIFYLPA